ncbi:MAG: FAD-binding protein, partial [Proteobacteria bacterium]|nr:FAD-binding protein [Pseudomonadota bacterium]NDG98830.1 FAD-binding protein [Pseudomonadota bacterium]
MAVTAIIRLVHEKDRSDVRCRGRADQDTVGHRLVLLATYAVIQVRDSYRARDAGCDVVVLEREAQASGSTALSSGFIPACETRFQREKGVRDSVETMVADILAKNHQETDPDIATAICRTSGPAIEWLAPFEIRLGS